MRIRLGAWLLRAFLLAVVVFSFLPMTSRADVGEAFGYGSRSSALAGASAAGGWDAYASRNNPAGLAAPGQRPLRLGYSLLFMRPRFTPISGVVVENTVVSDKGPRSGDVDTSYRDTFGHLLGAAVTFSPRWWNLSLGVSAFIPLAQLAYLDTGETFLPEYVQYRTRTNRPQVDVGIAFRPVGGFSVGAGLRLSLDLTSRADVFLQTTANKPSSMRFQASMKPRLTPTFGVHHQFDSGLLEGVASGLVVRLATTSQGFLDLSAGARVFGEAGAFPFKFSSTAALYYDPLSIELGTVVPHFSWGKLYLQVDWQRWTPYRAPALAISNPQSGDCDTPPYCSLQVSSGWVPVPTLRNTWTPRVAEEVRLGKHTVRAGYSYRPGIFAEIPSGAGNMIDPSRHIFTWGYGYEFSYLGAIEIPWNLDFNLGYQALVSQTVSKTSGDELGAGSGDSKVGAPGYTAGGKVFGGGVSVTLAL